MVEFSEDLSKRYEGGLAMMQRAFYRLSVFAEEIPYFNGGVDLSVFGHDGNIAEAVQDVLSDFQADVSVSGDRVLIGDIALNLPGSLT